MGPLPRDWVDWLDLCGRHGRTPSGSDSDVGWRNLEGRIRISLAAAGPDAHLSHTDQMLSEGTRYCIKMC